MRSKTKRSAWKAIQFLGAIIATAAAVATALAQGAGPNAQQQQAIDLAHRDPAIHWPAGFDPQTAAQFSHNQLLIDRPCDRVFARMESVNDWPRWFVLVKDVKLLGSSPEPIVGSTISFLIFGTPVTAKITELQTGERISWLPTTVGPSGAKHYHAWHFIPVGGNCEVVTEEVGVGPEDAKLGAQGSYYMHRAHDLWLASLRYASEQ